jgi:hypothetical protein
VVGDIDGKADAVDEAAVELGIASINEVSANGTYLRTGQALFGKLFRPFCRLALSVGQ